jgi:ubiquinone biosynthesis monooxygenase Coq7
MNSKQSLESIALKDDDLEGINLDGIDKIVAEFDNALRSIFAKPQASRVSPADQVEEQEVLTEEEKQSAIELMRVNHVGEVCAQALYQGQALTARSEAVKQKMSVAAQEELDHLNWCQNRLDELGGRVSLLNPLWYSASFALGATAGAIGDKWSLGFLKETEIQVEQHLAEHLDKLPQNDVRSRAVVKQMKVDEAEHAHMAAESGAAELPKAVKAVMQGTANIMKVVAAKV